MMNLDKYCLLLASLFFVSVTAASEVEGTLTWSRVVHMGFVVTGVVERIQVKAGERINKGDVMVRLEQQPFVLDVKKFKAGTEVIEPLLFDARIELEQAEELYDRTVLSQIELQRVEARHRGLEAQSRVAQAEYEMAKWRQEKSQLRAPFEGIVIRNDFLSGQILSEENKGDVSLQLAPVGVMAVTALVSAEQSAMLSIGKPVKVNIGTDQLAGTVLSMAMWPDDQSLFRSVIEFKHPQDKRYYAGQKAKVIFQ